MGSETGSLPGKPVDLAGLIQAYSTDTHYEYSNRQLGAYIIRYNQNDAVIKIIGGRII